MMEYFYLWPSGSDYLGKSRAYSHNFQTIMQFYSDHQYVPYLQCPLPLMKWAKNFFSEHAPGAIPVVIQIRCNTGFSPERNSKADAWKGFISHYIPDKEIVFFIAGLRKEIPDEIRALPNVVVIKDQGTTLDQDLALISVSPLYLGVPSGPAAMAYLSEKPYILFNYQTSNENVVPGSQFPFASENQTLIWEPESEISLIREFSKVLVTIDRKQWRNKTNNDDFSKESICLCE
jgi:ADP-heptose:LPS heptosyltransferase